jgi:hypothetical protein
MSLSRHINKLKEDIENKPYPYIDYDRLTNAIDYLESGVYNELRSQLNNKTYIDLAMMYNKDLEVGGSRTKIERRLDVIGAELASMGLIPDDLTNAELEDSLRSIYEQIQNALKLQKDQIKLINDYYNTFYGKREKTIIKINKEVIINPPKYMVIRKIDNPISKPISNSISKPEKQNKIPLFAIQFFFIILHHIFNYFTRSFFRLFIRRF